MRRHRVSITWLDISSEATVSYESFEDGERVECQVDTVPEVLRFRLETLARAAELTIHPRLF